MVVLPELKADAVVVWPVVGARIALVVALESLANETFWISISRPPKLLKAWAMNDCVPPMLTRADAGWTSIRVSGGAPNGVPSARVPGENVRPAEFALAWWATNAPPLPPISASGERVSD